MDTKANIEAMINSYSTKINELKAEIEKYQNAIDALRDLPEFNNSQSGSSLAVKSKTMGKSNIKHTLNQKVKKILKEIETPLTSRDLMNLIIENFPNSKYTFKTWSGTFSQMYTKERSGINKYEVKNAPVQYSAFYGLDEWFQNGILKQLYKRKIEERYDFDLSTYK